MYDSDRTMISGRGSSDYGSDDLTMPGVRNARKKERFVPGDVIIGRYKVISELGQGGMGVVYKCFDEDAGIEIALKALPPELSHNTMEMEDIKENFQLVSKLVHQNIAISKNLEKDRSNGNYYIIMECCSGDDMRSWIRRKRREAPLTLEMIVPVIRQIADALDYAHKQLVIHRDIKPGNIMIDHDGNVKVLDFGLAAQIHTSMTRVSMAYHGTSGTGPYMAPEQWRGRSQKATADQYALAVVAYEMLAGHLPFESGDAAVLREAVLNDTPEDIPGVPSYVRSALHRAMSKDPAERFESCNAFVDALSGRKSGRKHSAVPVLAVSAAAAAVLACGAGVYFYMQYAAKKSKDSAWIIYNSAAEKRSVVESGSYDRGQKFGGYLDEVKNNLEQGKILFDSGKYSESADRFSKAEKAAEWIIRNGKLREASAAKIRNVKNIKLSCDKNDVYNTVPEIYSKAVTALKKAEEKYEEADFSGADSYCTTAAELFADAGKKATEIIRSRHIRAAEKYLAGNDFFYAGKEIEAALKKYPDSEELKKLKEKILAAGRKDQAVKELRKAENALSSGRYDAVEQFLSGASAALLKDDPRVRSLKEKLEPPEFFSDDEFKNYILRKCRYIKSEDYYVKEAVQALKSFDFKEFGVYKKQHNLIADCISVGAGVNAVKYLHENHKISLNERFGWVKNTLLMTAAMKNNFEVISYLVDKGADVNAVNTVPYDAVKYLISQKNCNIDALRLLISKGAKTDRVDDKNKTLADLTPSFEAAAVLIENGVKLTDPDDLFRKAAENGKTEFIKRNIEKAVSTADILCYACRSGDMELIKLLERSGAKWHHRSSDGSSALHFAIVDKNDDTLFKYVLSKIPDMANTPDNDNRTPLMSAASKGNIKVVKLLVEKYGADVNAVNKDNLSSLSFAAMNDHLETVRYLASKNARVDVKSKWGQTPLFSAIHSDKTETVKCLVEIGASLTQRDNNGWTPLHSAVNRSNIAIVRILLKHKAPVNLKANPDSGFETVLMSAVSSKNLELVELLVESGADIKFRSSSGSSALSIAENGSTIKKYLVECMDDPSFTVSEDPSLLPDHVRTGFYAEAGIGDANALLKMGDIYLDGKITAKNIPLAVKYFKKAAAAGNRDAFRKLGNIYLKERKHTLALIWMERGAARGDGWAMYDLGEMYMDGVCVKRDYRKAHGYFKQAVNAGVDMAWDKIGLMNMYGLGRPVDPRLALEAYKRSTASGSERKAREAQEYLDFAAAPKTDWLFPVYGIMPGRTTLDELKSMSSKVSGTEYTVNDFDVHFEKGRIDRVMLTLNSDKWPGQWYHLGYNPGMSFNEWCNFLSARGYNIKVTEAPKLKKYQGNDCFSGRFKATRSYPVNHEIEFDFNFLPNASADDRNTLYACYIWFRGGAAVPAPSYSARRQNVTKTVSSSTVSAPVPSRNASADELKRRLTGRWFFYGTSRTSAKVFKNNLLVNEKNTPAIKYGELFNFKPDGTLFYVNLSTGADGKKHKSNCTGTWRCSSGGEVFINLLNPKNKVRSFFKAAVIWNGTDSVELKYDTVSYQQMLQKQIDSLPGGTSFGVPEVFYKNDGSMVQVMHVSINQNGETFNNVVTTETSRKIFNRRK